MRSKLIFIFLTCFFLCPVRNNACDEKQIPENVLYELEEEVASHLKIRQYKLLEIEKFKKILDDLKIRSPLEKFFSTDKTLCGLCKLLISQIQERTLTVKILGEAICNLYITLSTWTVSSFCAEIIGLNLPILEYILENSKILDPELACSVLLQNNQCYYKKPALTWRIQVPSTSQMKIPSIRQTMYILTYLSHLGEKRVQLLTTFKTMGIAITDMVTYNPNTRPLKILHLTDIHITPDYDVGGVQNCGYPLCCKKDLGNPLLGSNAGKWGDYNCDIPVWLFGSTMFHLNYTHKDIDLVYFTGDIIDHTGWKSSVEDNSNLIYFVYKTLFETFPNKPVLPAIGNHEPTPLNVFAPTEKCIEEANLSTQWLYTLLSKVWKAWLPNDSLETVKKQGYYAYLVNKKFKIISLNNNVCYNFNWWVLYNTTFLTEQLEFLSDELQKAEENGQFVHIIAHIPVGNKECIEPWEASYNSLVKRFSHIIKGHFYGHTHTDELKVFYDENQTPINVGYNGASLTPYVKYNPSYKVMTVDPNTYEVLDIDTYYFNLTDANLHPDRNPRWFKLYSMKEAYGLEKLSPQNIGKMAQELFQNQTLFNLYWRFYVREGDASLKDGCNNNCRKEIICKIFSTESLSPNNSECT